jgi:RNA polymerase sigma-70 factor (ECF subfamily)
MASETEAQLLARARAGDYEAFEALVSPHERRLFAVAQHLVGPDEAADALQSGLLHALDSFATFRGEAAFGTWLSRIVTNEALKLLRVRRQRPAVSLDGLREDDAREVTRPEFVADWREDPSRSIEQGELRRLLDEAIAVLPENHRVVFVLRDVVGLDTDATAKELAISPGNVKIRLLRARLALRERLTRAFGDERRRVHMPQHSHKHVVPARPKEGAP